MDKKILNKVLKGLSDRNIRFPDLKKLLNDLGFSMRTKGDHHIFYREGIEEIVNLQPLKDDELVKSQKTPFFVIPANPGSWSGAGAGIQFYQLVREFLDSGFHRSDDFLRNH